MDSYDAAKKLQLHINTLEKYGLDENQYTAIVVGGGFTGIEVATDLMDRLSKTVLAKNRKRVIIIDRSEVASPFESEMKSVILEALDELGIEVYPDTDEGGIDTIFGIGVGHTQESRFVGLAEIGHSIRDEDDPIFIQGRVDPP